MSVRLIGDVHGNCDEGLSYPRCDNPQCIGRSYLSIIYGSEFSIQLGDHGFNYDHLWAVNPSKHKVLGGNHDQYNVLPSLPHYLGDFGVVELGGIRAFFIRGAISIDKALRISGISWWQEEELTYQQGKECLIEYEREEPEIVISHDCPFTCYQKGIVTNPYKRGGSPTSKLLNQCLNIHQPNYWFFAHHHKNWVKKISKTTFVCLNELCYLDVDDKTITLRKGEIMQRIT